VSIAAANIEWPLGFPYSGEHPNTLIASVVINGRGSWYAIFVRFITYIVKVMKNM